MSFKNQDLKTLFNECNNRYFNNVIPTDIKIEWSNKMTCSAGQYSYKRNRLTDEVFNKRIILIKD